MLKSVITALSIGILGGFWFALVNGNIEIFQNYADGVWRYQVGVRSFAAPIVGAIIGGLAGSNIRLALAPERADGFIRGALVGLAVGVMLVSAQLVLVALAASFGDYRVPYQSLLTRFSGILLTATISGASTGLFTRNCPPVGIMPSTVTGALIGVSFALPVIVTVALIVASAPGVLSGTNLIPLYLPFSVGPIVGAAVGAIINAIADRITRARRHDMLTFIAVTLGAVAGVTASSTSFFYVVMRQSPPVSVVYEFHLSAGMLCGVAVGMAVILAARRIISTRRADAGMMDDDSSTN